MFKYIPKKIIVISACVFLALGLIVAGLFVYLSIQLNINEQDNQANQATDQVVLTPALEQANQEAQSLSAGGDVDAAVIVIDEAIEEAETDEQKAVLLNTKSTTLVNSNPPQAIAAAEESFALNAAYDTADFLALLYEQEGNNEEAIRYYRIALELYNQQEFFEASGQADAAYYERKIEELSQ